MRIYKSGEEDKDSFVKLRIELFDELGERDEKITEAELKRELESYYLEHINKDFFCWFAEIDGKVIGVASMCMFCRIPYYQNPVGLEGYILNVFTLPQYRKNGAASRLVKEIIDFSRKGSIKRLWLNASDAGRKIYKTLGFSDSYENQMELFL